MANNKTKNPQEIHIKSDLFAVSVKKNNSHTSHKIHLRKGHTQLLKACMSPRQNKIRRQQSLCHHSSCVRTCTSGRGLSAVHSAPSIQIEKRHLVKDGLWLANDYPTEAPQPLTGGCLSGKWNNLCWPKSTLTLLIDTDSSFDFVS